MWWRVTASLRGSRDTCGAGNTNCQRHSRCACGHFSRKHIRESDGAQSCGQIAVVLLLRAIELRGQRRQHAIRQHGDPILVAFAIADEDVAPLEIDIVHPQPNRFHDAQARAVEEPADQSVDAVEAIQNRRDFGLRVDRRQSLRHARPDHAVEPRQVDTQHLAVEEKQSGFCLVLSRARDVVDDRQGGEEGFDLGRAQFRRMTLAVVADEASNPRDVGLLRAKAVVLHAYDFADAVEERRRGPGERMHPGR